MLRHTATFRRFLKPIRQHKQKLQLILSLNGCNDLGARNKKEQKNDEDKFLSLRNEEFARQTLAGVNPVSVEKLKVFPLVHNRSVFSHLQVDATSNWTWQLAKAHVCSNDAWVHHLSHHWGMAVPDPSQRHVAACRKECKSTATRPSKRDQLIGFRFRGRLVAATGAFGTDFTAAEFSKQMLIWCTMDAKLA
ncbi:linoleate 13S-lipoxygenase 3-1, chloroplastic-like protein [Tanacetum coccineum]